MRSATPVLVIALFLAASLIGGAAAEVTFTEVPVEELHTSGLYCNMALSEDGSEAGIFWGFHVYRWNPETGLMLLADNTQTSSTASINVSGDGSTFIATIKDSMDFTDPAIWRLGEGWTHLGGIDGEPPLGTEYGTASALNGDGTMATGLGWARNDEGWLRATPFLWTEGEGMIGLPKADNNHQARGNDLSDDGQIVVGWNENDFGSWRPCRWINEIGPDFFLGEETLGVVDAISGNGVFYALAVNGAAHRYSDEDGLSPIGIYGWPYNRVYGVSNDGTVIGYDGQGALIWTEEGGLRTVADVLTEAGCTDHQGWTLFWAVDISSDGSTIIGAGTKPNGWAGVWIAQFPSPASAPDPRPLPTCRLACSPNPFSRRATVAYSLDKPASVRLAVYDLDGRMLTTLTDGKRSPGNYSVTWNGITDDGHRAASGTYFIRLITPRATATHKIQLLR